MEEAMRPVESVAPRIKIFKFSSLGYSRTSMYCTVKPQTTLYPGHKVYETRANC